MSKKDKTPGTGLDGDDARLWKQMTGDVERLPGRTYTPPPEEAAPAQKPKKEPRETPVLPEQAPKPVSKGGGGLDKRTDERLRRGQMEIEARLDLHGMTQDEAQTALGRFLQRCYERGQRSVLVITGQGRNKENQPDGILRRRVPEWLKTGAAGEIVLRSYPARPKDGGAGARYVLLRRKR